MFGTESCLPIYGLQEAGRILFEHDTSWLHARHKGEVSVRVRVKVRVRERGRDRGRVGGRIRGII